MQVFPVETAQADDRLIVGRTWSREERAPYQMNWKAILTTMAVSALTIFVVFRLGVGRTQIVGA